MNVKRLVERFAGEMTNPTIGWGYVMDCLVLRIQDNRRTVYIHPTTEWERHEVFEYPQLEG